MNMIMQNLTERLRPLVGLQGWDYCVLWKLSEDQRFIELMNCCCSGSDENTQIINGGQELVFPVYPALPCRDTMHHSRTNSCHLLAQLPSSLPLASGIYAQALISNQPIWLNTERDGTRVLVPTAGGLIELFVSKDVSKDEQVVDFVTAQCNISQEQDTLLSAGYNMSTTEIKAKSFLGNGNEGTNDHMITNNNHSFHQPPPVSPAMSFDCDSNLPFDISVDRIRLCSTSPMNFMSNNYDNNNVHYDQIPHEPLGDMGLQANPTDAVENMEQQGVAEDQDSFKHDGGRAADQSVSDCSDQIEDEGDMNYKRRTGKGPQAKNLVAERKRRKKLNERLYRLRALVPNISKMDKAAILGDAIEFVKDLLRQVKELQDELEHNSTDEGRHKDTANKNQSNFQPEILGQNEACVVSKPESDEIGNISKQNQDSDGTNDRGQQMEPQVGVTQLDGNEFFVTVFCEHKAGGFVRLMEAMDALGLEVTNANVTSFRSLVSNVFKVEKKDSEIVQADDVRDSLLEITRNPSKPLDHFHHDNHHHQHHYQQQHHLQNYHTYLYN